MARYALAVDIGGTFTDVVLRSAAGSTFVDKTLTTPESLDIGFFRAVDAVLAKANIAPSAVTDVDVTAAEMLEQLDNELNAAGIHLAFAEMRSRLRDLTLRYGLLETLDSEHFYPTLEAALEEIQAHQSVPGHPE